MKKKLDIFKDRDLLNFKNICVLTLVYIVGYILSFVPSYINKLVIDDIENGREINYFVLAVIVLGFSILISYMLNNYVVGYYIKKVRKNLMNKLFKRSITMPSYIYNSYGNNQVLGYYMFDSINVSDAIVKKRFSVKIALIQSIVTFGILFYINIKLTYYVLFSIPLLFFSISINNMKLKSIQQKMVDSRNKLMGTTQNFVLHKKDIYMYRNDKYFENIIDDNLSDFIRNQKKFQFLTLFLKRLPVLISILFPVILLFVGADFIKNNQMTLGNLFFYIGIANLFYIPLTNTFVYLTDIKSYMLNVERVDEFLYKKYDLENYNNLFYDIDSLIKINNCKIYNDKGELLYRANLSIDSNGFYIIKGPNGSGKSTLFNLIAGIYNPKQIDGEFKISKKLMHNISLLKYPLFFIEDSVRNNLFNNNINNIFDIELEKNIKTNPLNLSSGEAQKVALTRVLSEDRKLVLLDEPISNLEKSSIQKLGHYIQNNKSKKVIIAIMHDDSYDDIADKIFEINGGVMEERDV